MTPRGIRLGLLLAILSSPVIADDLGQSITCCEDQGECDKLDTYIWRQTDYGVDVMLFPQNWCPIRLYPLRPVPIFDGKPMDFCAQLACFPTK
jgi:hypothetical protein